MAERKSPNSVIDLTESDVDEDTYTTSHTFVRIQWESQKAYNRQPRPIYHGMDI